MEIGKNQGIQVDAYVNQVHENKRADQAIDRAKESATKTDTVVISDAAKRIQEARAKLDEIPDVREDKVAELRNQIQNGTYQIDADKIAVTGVSMGYFLAILHHGAKCKGHPFTASFLMQPQPVSYLQSVFWGKNDLSSAAPLGCPSKI